MHPTRATARTIKSTGSVSSLVALLLVVGSCKRKRQAQTGTGEIQAPGPGWSQKHSHPDDCTSPSRSKAGPVLHRNPSSTGHTLIKWGHREYEPAGDVGDGRGCGLRQALVVLVLPGCYVGSAWPQHVATLPTQ